MTDIKDPTQTGVGQHTVHQAFAEIVQDVYDQYGVKIEQVDFQWVDMMDGRSKLITTEVDSRRRAD